MMNSLMYQKSNFNTKACHYVPLKNDRPLISKKRVIQNNSFEHKPLISPDSDSCSDDEINLHDIRHVKLIKDGLAENYSLRKIKKSNAPVTNGNVSENKTTADPFQNCEFLNLKIEESDTLQSIAIKYHCSISDIKRANNLISDQEFFALKNLKIPVKKYGLLTEILPAVSTDKDEFCTVKEQPENNIRVINIGIGQVGRCPSPQETATFFQRMDEDLVKIMLSTQTQKESLEAATVALTSPQIQPLVKDPYNTVDCGIQWNYLLMFVIILAIVIPAAVTVYMYLRSSHTHHHEDVYTSSSSNETFNPVSKMKSKS